MKPLLIFLIQTLIIFSCYGQGKVVIRNFVASSIENNRGGENPKRQVSVYLPPGYDESTSRYPVIYFLHGVGTTDSDMFLYIGLKELMDNAITTRRIQPMILVVPNSDSRFRGSFYTNSNLTGNWADFIGKDLVAWADKNFRTIPDRKSRGLSGHSMGGNGALKVGMLFTDTFSAVYAMSPAVLNWANDFTIRNSGFKRISKAQTEAEILAPFNNPNPFVDEPGFWGGVLAAMGRAYSPEANADDGDEQNLAVHAKMPVHYIGDSAIINADVIKQWEANFPINMIETYLPGLRSLAALKIDWGRNEEFPHIPATCMQFSKKLEMYQIKHFAEEYIGAHVSHLDGLEGRVYTELLPFFDRYLKFESVAGKNPHQPR